MFQNVRQNSQFYILDKGEEKSLLIGSVESVSNPTPRYNNSYTVQPYGSTDMVVDIVVKVGEEKREYKQLPANLTIANFGTGIVVSDDRQAMCSEIESWVKNSKNHIESVPYHEDVIEKGEQMILTLNPQLAKDKQQEERINALEGQMNGISENINKMMGMMSGVLGVKSKNQKSSNYDNDTSN